MKRSLLKPIVDLFASLSLTELRNFINQVIIPQDALNLLEHAMEAEKIILKNKDIKDSKKNE